MAKSHHSEEHAGTLAHCLSRFSEKVLTLPYFSPACLAGFDANCDRGLEQMLYLHALIEDDNAQVTGLKAAAAD